MDDKMFNEIMNNYVSSKSNGKEIDFAKLEVKQKAKSNRKKLRLIYSSVTLLLVVAITLAIALPLTLNKNTDTSNAQGDEKPPTIQYFEPAQIEFINIESYENFQSEYGFSVTMPTIENQDMAIYVIQNIETKETIGVYLEILIYDVIFDIVKVYIMRENTKLSSLAVYEDLVWESSWNDSTVKYYTAYSELDYSYTTRMVCAIGDYEYYMDAVYYEDLQIAELLGLIF